MSLFFLLFFFHQNSFASSVFTHINTNAFVSMAKSHYLAAVATNPQRSGIISLAQSECGGRYEGTELKIVELSHDINTIKNIIHGATPDDYILSFDADASVVWVVTETIKCSVHGGHARSLLHSVIMRGTDHAIVSYPYHLDTQVSAETVSGITRSYSIGSRQNASLYKTPYGTIVP